MAVPITGLTDIAGAVDNADWLAVVDVSDLTQASTGTTKKLKMGSRTPASERLYNVEDPTYGAVPDAYFTDGVANATTTFTSATAAFVAGDVGKTIVILKAGASQFQDHHTTIASITNGTTVVLTNAAGRSQSTAKFYISRSGDQTAAIQAAIDAAETAGGGDVLCPGVGYLVAGLTMKGRVTLRGRGARATMLHMLASTPKPVITMKYADPSARFCTVRDLWIDGNRVRQADITTTLSAAYTAGDATVSLTAVTNFLPAGEILIGTNRLYYQSISGTTLQTVTGGAEGTTDANASNGATVTQHPNIGIYGATTPFSGTIGTNDEETDTQHLIEHVYVKNCKGEGISLWGWGEARVNNCYVQYTDHAAFRPSFDTWLNDCTAATSGRMGFFVRWSSTRLTNCKAFYSGGNTAAEGWGFLIEGPPIIEEGDRNLVACEAQDNKAEGFYLRNAQRVAMAACSASSNGTSSAGTYAGVKIDGCTNGIVDCMCTERVASPNNSQRESLQILSTSIQTTGMIIRISHGATSGSAVLDPIKTGSDLTGANVIVINGADVDGVRYVAAASTANITISGPGATIDGVTMAVNDRFLAANQTTVAENGIYVWKGSAVAAVRASDADTGYVLRQGTEVKVLAGTVNAATTWRQMTANLITVGTTSVRFTRISPDLGIQVSGAASRGFLPTSAKMESFDRTQIAIANVTVIATSGTVQLGPLGLLRAGQSFAGATIFAGTTAGASLTHSWMGIARFSDRKLLAVSTDDTTASWGANTSRAFTWSAYTADQDETLWWVLLVTGTTIPTFLGMTHGNAATYSTPVILGRSNTGQTTPIAVNTILTAPTAGGAFAYVQAT